MELDWAQSLTKSVLGGAVGLAGSGVGIAGNTVEVGIGLAVAVELG